MLKISCNLLNAAVKGKNRMVVWVQKGCVSAVHTSDGAADGDPWLPVTAPHHRQHWTADQENISIQIRK